MNQRRLAYTLYSLAKDIDYGATEIKRALLGGRLSGAQAEVLMTVLSVLSDRYLERTLSPFEVRALREHVRASMRALAVSRGMILRPLAKCVPRSSAEGRELKTGRTI